jgi:hypothetical protein
MGFIINDVFRDEITAGAEVLLQKIKMYRPKIVAFNGRGLNKKNSRLIILFIHFRHL